MLFELLETGGPIGTLEAELPMLLPDEETSEEDASDEDDSVLELLDELISSPAPMESDELLEEVEFNMLELVTLEELITEEKPVLG